MHTKTPVICGLLKQNSIHKIIKNMMHFLNTGERLKHSKDVFNYKGEGCMWYFSVDWSGKPATDCY